MKMKLLLTMAILMSLHITALAEGASPPKNPDLKALAKSWEESRDIYRDALKANLKALQETVKQKEILLENENDSAIRKVLLEQMRGIQAECDDLNTKIREINASDVVKFSTGRDKIFSALTGQTTT